jgi:hypothetical protein
MARLESRDGQRRRLDSSLSVTFSSTAGALMAANAVGVWKGFFTVLLLGWSAIDEVYG